MPTISRDIAGRLLERLDMIRIQPQVILVLGVEVDYVAQRLHQRYPQAEQSALLHAKALAPLEKHSADLIFSNLAFYTNSEIETAFLDFSRLLKPGGLLLFTTFGPDTLKELNLNDSMFVDMHNIGDMLLHGQFLDPVMDMELITVNYVSPSLLQEDIHALGLSFDKKEDVPSATIELIYGHAWGAVEKNTAGLNEQGEVVILVDAIRRP